MSLGEIGWRFGQKCLSSYERKTFAWKTPVYDVDAYGLVPKADFSRLGICLDNNSFSVGAEIELLGGYSYTDYRKRWHAAFQTPVDWPVRFASDYSFGVGDVPGDIRTNWELNRHRQFAILAKSYYLTKDTAYLAEFTDLFDDWNLMNPFMWGPEWSSPMEVSIRLINWLFAAAFLEASDNQNSADLVSKLSSGAWTMAGHVRRHYSRYSSANNHTIVEATGVAVAASVFGQTQWLEEALSLLESEVCLQTYADGVNKEQALHYQLFAMEALCLVSHVLRTDGKSLPETLVGRLYSMARYARACCVGKGIYIEFGDDDEGVILNLAKDKPRYAEYVLALTTLELGSDMRWSEDIRCCETLGWLYCRDRLADASALPLAENDDVESFPEGGVTIVRFDEGRAVLAFDHGPLGFGQLAAHGHADALSLQLFVDGEPVLIDPGTYVYNGNPGIRGRFRSTRAHNTVCVGGKNQSEALGPFLWGRKAGILGYSLEKRKDCVCVSAEHDGYSPTRVRRTVEVRKANAVITDVVDDGSGCIAYLHIPSVGIEAHPRVIKFLLNSGTTVCIDANASIEKAAFKYSPAYGVLADGTEICAIVLGELITNISIMRDSQ